MIISVIQTFLVDFFEGTNNIKLDINDLEEFSKFISKLNDFTRDFLSCLCDDPIQDMQVLISDITIITTCLPPSILFLLSSTTAH